MKKSDVKVLIILSAVFLCLVMIYTGINNIYGSMTDWVMQHTVLPDYFRTLFYSTGNLFPNLAMNVGAGQNIYYFSYYGLLNPFILLSYLLPFIKMTNYIMIINIIIVIGSAFLMYKWLSHHKYDHQVSLIVAILFMLANAFFQTHRQIMFIDYMPFLMLGLIGIDKYFEDKKSTLYIASVFLMIMTSYYYSVGGLLCLLIYGIYQYLKINKHVTIKSFLFDGFKFLIPMFIGILMSFVLLVPTVFAIMSSRSQVNDVESLITLFIPQFNFNSLLYDNYGMGFTSISLIALFYVISNKQKEKRFLSGALLFILTIPIIMYMLNGMLYIRGKVLIPMMPLVSLLVAMFLNALYKKEISLKKFIVIIAVSVAIALIFDYGNVYFYGDLLITSLAIILYVWLKKCPIIMYTIVLGIALVSNIAINTNDNYVNRNLDDQLKTNNVSNLVHQAISHDQTFYRMNNLLDNTSMTVNKVYDAAYYQTSLYSSTYNSNYQNLFNNNISNAIPYRNSLITASSNNIMFQTLMGIKYVISNDSNVPIGYNLLKEDNGVGLYQNESVFPLGYSSSALMSYDTFKQLDNPYQSEALLHNIIVNKDVTSNYTSSIKKTNLDYQYLGDVKIKQDQNKYIIDTSKEETVTFKLNKSLANQILFISFKLDEAQHCNDGDLSITINHVTNKLTCKEWLYFNNNYNFEYALSNPKDIGELTVTFSKGHFVIENVNVYTLDYDTIKNITSQFDQFVVNRNKTKGDVIEGDINVTQDGYFATTIPYDDGFDIYANNKKIKYEKVNGSFIGFPVLRGTYNIKMVYHSPGFDKGAIGTSLGFLIFFMLMIKEVKRKK